jgi:transposase
MPQNLSKFEEKVNLLLQAKTIPKDIATTLKKPLKSIHNSIARIKKKKDYFYNSNRVKTGRVSKLSPREKRVINRDLLLSPKKTNKRILFENDLAISNRGLQRFLKEEGYYINIASKKPYISAKNAKLRVKYCKEALKSYKEKGIKVNKIVFSDESTIERGHGARPEYARTKGRKVGGRRIVSSKNKSKFFKIPNRLYYPIFYSLSFYNFSFLVASKLT